MTAGVIATERASLRMGPSPRPHQVDALDALASAYQRGVRRAQLRMACGSGKTLVGPWLAARLAARTVVVFTPSIGLVAQTMAAWRDAGIGLRALALCSDASTATGRAELGVDGIDPYRGGHDVAGVVTTQSREVAAFLDAADPLAGELTVIVSTYHSAGVLAEALTLTDRCRSIDLVIADEAHHLAGRTDARFVPVLRDRTIPARWRLFQTATPVVLGNLARAERLDEHSGAADLTRCMDDENIFGPVAYTLSVGDAVEAGLLVDYRVIVAAPGGSEVGAAPERAALGAVSDVVSRYGVRRILTFHNRVAAARDFARRVDELGRIGGLPVRGHAVDGAMRDTDRRRVLDELAATSSETVTVVASAQCLREGVDVPAVDAVVFADPRTSAVGIIQAIGRALRTHPGKTVGTIVVPLVIDPAADDQEQLAGSAYRHVWKVLRGLRAHDARVGFDIDRARVSQGRRGNVDPAALSWLEVTGDDPGAVITRLLQRTSSMWEHYYGQLLAAVAERGSAAKITTSGTALGHWIALQRIHFRDGTIDAERSRRLEAVAGWRWDAAKAADERALATLQSVAEAHGTVADRLTGESIYTGYTDGLRRPLRLWVATQLCKYRDGVLDDWLREGLQRLPGWSWTPLEPDDDDGFVAYRSFVEWEGHTDITDDTIEDDYPLGKWIAAIRRRKALGSLPPLLEAMLLATAPPDNNKNGERRFAWKTAETRWAIGIDAARSYVSRHATIATVPYGHTEAVDGHPIDLYSWITRVRHLHHHRGNLGPEQIAAVEQLPGWVWRARPGGRRGVQISEPLPHVAEHGVRGARAGCHCATCVTALRAYNRVAAKSRREAFRVDWVDAGDVRDHLLTLAALDAGKDRSDACFTPGAIAAAAGVPTRLVSSLLAGTDTPRCHPMHRRALLATNPADVRAIRSEQRSRGRRAITGHARQVDPEPTWRILDELTAAGWTPKVLATAMGYSSASHLPARGKPVNAATAKIVRLLHDSLNGDLTPSAAPPPRRRRKDGTAINQRNMPAEQWALSLLRQGYQIERIAQRTGLSESLVTALAQTDLSGR